MLLKNNFKFFMLIVLRCSILKQIIHRLGVIQVQSPKYKDN